MVPLFMAAELAQQGLQSVWVPYTTYRYGWSVAQIGESLAVVGLLFAISQCALVRPVVARFGELRTLTLALVVAVVSMLARSATSRRLPVPYGSLLDDVKQATDTCSSASSEFNVGGAAGTILRPLCMQFG